MRTSIRLFKSIKGVISSTSPTKFLYPVANIMEGSNYLGIFLYMFTIEMDGAHCAASCCTDARIPEWMLMCCPIAPFPLSTRPLSRSPS